MTNQDLQTRLETLLNMHDQEHVSFVVPSEESVEGAMDQWEAVNELTLDPDMLNAIQNILSAIDLLNTKYEPEYQLDAVNLDQIAGLKLSYERAVGAVIYGIVGPMYQLFGEQPRIFQALFGRQLGRILFAQAQRDIARLERLTPWWQQAVENPQSFRPMIEDEVTEMTGEQIKLAVSLGYPEVVARRVESDFHLDRVKGVPIDLEAIAREIQVTASEATKQRIKEGRELIDSGLYFTADILNSIDDDEKRRKLRDALQAAKDKDRLQARRNEERGKKDD